MEEVRSCYPEYGWNVSSELAELLFDISVRQKRAKHVSGCLESADFRFRPGLVCGALIQTEATPPTTIGEDRENDANVNAQR